jgi:hypothetical protein
MTVKIPDSLFRAAREYGASRGISLRMLIERGLRLAIEQPRSATRFDLMRFGFQGEGQQIQGWSAVRETIYEGRGDVSAPVPTPRRGAR